MSEFRRHRAAGAGASVIHGERNLYGFAVGILMIQGHFPRPPGAIGNATTFPYPVLHRVVEGATGAATVRRLPDLEPDSAEYAAAVAPWIEGARELERQGVRAITTSCGFAALIQNDLTNAVEVPVFATSLLLAPLIARGLRSGRKVGIITADSRTLGPRHLDAVGIDPSTIAVAGLEACPLFEEMAYEDRHDIDLGQLEEEVLDVAHDLVGRDPAVGALLLECSLLPPYAASIQNALKLPVFDFTHLIDMMQSAVVRHPFKGYL